MYNATKKWMKRVWRSSKRRVEAPRSEESRDSAVDELIRYFSTLYLYSSSAPLIRFFDEDSRNGRRNGR